MSSSKKNDWDVVKEITYAVVEEIKGRGTSFDDTLAKTLGVSGDYMVMYIPNDHNDSKHYYKLFKELSCSNYMIIFRIG